MSGVPVFKHIDAAEDAKGTLTAFFGKDKKMQAAPHHDVVDLTGAPMDEAPAVRSDAALEVTPDAAGAVDAATGGADAAQHDAEPGPAPQAAGGQQAGDGEDKVRLGGRALLPWWPRLAECLVHASLPAWLAANTTLCTVAEPQVEKKRKRVSHTYTDLQTAGLEALFARTQLPNAAAKRLSAAELGLDVESLTKWFEKRRKQQREATGAPAARGRPTAAAAAAGGPTAMLVDAAPPAADAAPPAAPSSDPSPAGPMRLDQAGQVAPTPAADIKAPETMVKAAPPGPASAPPPASAPAPAAQPSSAAAAARHVSADERAALLAELQAEAQALRAGGLAAPLCDLGASAAAPAPFSDARLAALVAGQRMPLSALVAALLPAFAAGGDAAAPSADALRSCVVDLAARKSHAPKDAAAPGLMDALNDASDEALWQWELRDAKSMPKERRLAAATIKRRATRAGERLAAVAAAQRALQAHAAGKASGKLCRALDALARVKTLAQVDAEAAAEAAAAAAKAAAAGGKAAATAEQRAVAAAEKEAARAKKEAEKEAARMEKEAEKEAGRLDKEVEKERHRQEKEAERERKAAEAEEKKIRKKTGFKDVEQLHKTANKFAVSASARAARRPPHPRVQACRPRCVERSLTAARPFAPP
jgi:hypothetical protein